MESTIEKGLQQHQIPKTEYIMLCLPSQHYSNSWVLHQLIIHNSPATSAAFFRLLRLGFYAKCARGLLGILRFWLKVMKLHWVRFKLHSGTVHVDVPIRQR